MSILSDVQKSQLFGRLLGLPDETSPVTASVPERIAPTGTVAGTEPGNLVRQVTQNNGVMLVGGIIALLAVVWLARKVL